MEPKQNPKHSQKLRHLPKLYEEGNANYLLYLKYINNVSCEIYLNLWSRDVYCVPLNWVIFL